MELTARRAGQALLVVIALLVGAAFARDVLRDSAAQRELAAGNGVPGTFTLERRVRDVDGRPPPTWRWEGVFVSDDGTIVRAITSGPAEADPSEPGSAGRSPGDRVPAQWVPQTPHLAYATDADGGGWWVELLVLLVLPAVAVVATVLIRRRIRRDHPDGWRPEVPATSTSTSAPAPRPPDERTVNEARIKDARAEREHLRAELERIQRSKRT